MSKQLIPTSLGQRPKGKEAPAGSGQPGTEGRSPARRVAISVLPEALLLVAVTGLFFYARTFDRPPDPEQLGPAFWPQVLCCGLAVCSLLRLAQKLRAGDAPPAGAEVLGYDPGKVEDEVDDEPDVVWTKAALVAALVAGYVLGMVILGYVLATALFFVAYVYLGGQRRWYVVPLGVGSSLVFAYVFLKVVYISLPSGVGVFDQFSVLIYRMLGIY